MECTKCHLKKELAKGKRWCKDCKNAYEKQRKLNATNEKKNELKQKQHEQYQKKKKSVGEIKIDPKATKKCTKCLTEKSLIEFHLAKTKGTIRAMCKDCSTLARQKYYVEHKDEIIEKSSKYIIDKMKNDPIFKMMRYMRARIYHAFVDQDQSKNQRTIKYLGCTSSFLKEWIEYQLKEPMTLENYGDVWHIDHVKPCAVFDLSCEDQISECFCWKNLRPYLATENLKKSKKIILSEIDEQETKVLQFLKLNGLKSHQSKIQGNVLDINS